MLCFWAVSWGSSLGYLSCLSLLLFAWSEGLGPVWSTDSGSEWYWTLPSSGTPFKLLCLALSSDNVQKRVVPPQLFLWRPQPEKGSGKGRQERSGAVAARTEDCSEMGRQNVKRLRAWELDAAVPGMGSFPTLTSPTIRHILAALFPFLY